MRKAVLYGTLGLGAVGLTSICDLCTPAATAGETGGPRAAYAAPATQAVVPGASAYTATAPATAAAQTKTVRLKVSGMTCAGCVIGTRAVLTRLPGVTKADVSYERGDALVTYDPARVTVAQMVAAVKTLGYTATPVAE